MPFFSFSGQSKFSSVFFIILVALILPVVGFSIYRYHSRVLPRQGVELDGSGWNALSVLRAKPKLWDVWVVKNEVDGGLVQNDRLMDLLPLSATYVHDADEYIYQKHHFSTQQSQDDNSSVLDRTRESAPEDHRSRRRHWRPQMHAATVPVRGGSLVVQQQPRTVDVNVLILMPSLRKSKDAGADDDDDDKSGVRGGDSTGLGGYWIGSTRLMTS